MMMMMMMVMIIMLKNVAAQIGPRTWTHTLCGPAQSKRMSRFLQQPLYAQVICRKPKPRRRLCASLRSRSACQNFTRATSHTEIYRTNAAAQMGPRTRTHTHTHTHFVRACAVETHVKISQQPLYTEI